VFKLKTLGELSLLSKPLNEFEGTASWHGRPWIKEGKEQRERRDT